MNRLKRFDDFRFIGDRRTMKFYDCDDDVQFTELQQIVVDKRLWEENLLQTFAPDEPAEAVNRSFSPAV